MTGSSTAFTVPQPICLVTSRTERAKRSSGICSTVVRSLEAWAKYLNPCAWNYKLSLPTIE